MGEGRGWQDKGHEPVWDKPPGAALMSADEVQHMLVSGQSWEIKSYTFPTRQDPWDQQGRPGPSAEALLAKEVTLTSVSALLPVPVGQIWPCPCVAKMHLSAHSLAVKFLWAPVLLH